MRCVHPVGNKYACPLYCRAEMYDGRDALDACKEHFTVVNIHDLWSNYPCSIWHVMGLLYEKWGLPGANQNYGGPVPMLSAETPLP